MNGLLFPPKNITLNRSLGVLTVTWANGDSSCVGEDELRRYCACSACRGRHLVGVRLVTESARIEAVQLIGSNALQVVFVDGHNRGIFPWPYLYAISQGRALDYLNAQ